MSENEGQTTPQDTPRVDVSEPQAEALGDSESAETVDPRDILIAGLKEELKRTSDDLLRQLAEAQNIQRRLKQQMDQDRKYAVEGLIRNLIPVLDNFDRSIAAAEQGASPEAVIDGIRAMHKSLQRALEPVGLIRITAVGLPFDPERHEALATVETSDVPPETVTDEIEPGYILADRVVRPARVRVSRAPGEG
ncbi:MAG: nucleotide exchange factor GrpE [Armatimonadetes bacterium]|nr:nucleotide exchange factor GrpE [Armatimonadota bacterium]